MRSRVPAHPAIISVDVFIHTQLRHTKSAGGLATAGRTERGPGRAKRAYPAARAGALWVCQRRMAGEMVRANAFYRV